MRMQYDRIVVDALYGWDGPHRRRAVLRRRLRPACSCREPAVCRTGAATTAPVPVRLSTARLSRAPRAVWSQQPPCQNV